LINKLNALGKEEDGLQCKAVLSSEMLREGGREGVLCVCSKRVCSTDTRVCSKSYSLMRSA
jgi:hypothetical protein